MAPLDPLIGAGLALVIGWTSILLAIRLPLDQWIRPHDLRRAGGAALALLALHILGAPVAPWVALAVLGGGVALGVCLHWRRRKRVLPG